MHASDAGHDDQGGIVASLMPINSRLPQIQNAVGMLAKPLANHCARSVEILIYGLILFTFVPPVRCSRPSL
jgi:hypothetical protein